MEAAEAITAAAAGAASMLARETPSKVDTPSLAGFPAVEGALETAPALAAWGERGLVIARGERMRRGRKKREIMVESECWFMMIILGFKSTMKLYGSPIAELTLERVKEGKREGQGTWLNIMETGR